jgi:NAD(P)-dependent dehydrogenase (short-subunit alcohol dehydrogenase family)
LPEFGRLIVKGLIDGKIAVITGAGSGVGRAASLLFSQHGASVVVSDVDSAAAEETVAQVRESGGKAIAVTCNVADEESVNQLIRAAVNAYGRLDIMYNNAGITITPEPGKPLKSLIDASQEDINRLQAVNVGGVFNGCRAAIRQFNLQGSGGVIVNTASVAGLIGYGGVIYGATKGAVTNLTRTLALELASQGIRVNSVCPAGMPTNFIGKGVVLSEEARKRMGAALPLGRVIDPLDCAKAALFLASDLADNITGVNLPVDGGISAGIVTRR